MVRKLPVIDFAKCAINAPVGKQSDLRQVGERIFDTFASTGFVYLKNVGIKQDAVKKVLAVSKKFFDLDLETKQRYTIRSDCFGYIGTGHEKNSPKRPGDFKEAFDIIGTACVSNDTHWPDKEVPLFSSETKAFSESCRFLAERILSALTLGMKIKDENYLIKCHSRMNDYGNLTTLRTHYYPPIPRNVELLPDQVRLGEHTDFGSITILFQDQQKGLQVKTNDNHYIDATPIPNSVLVNVGDALQYWTRGRLRSTEHRILMPKSEEENVERRSLAYFVQANNEVKLSEIDYEYSTKQYMNPKQQFEDSPTVFEYLSREYKKINLQNLDNYYSTQGRP